MRVLVGWQHDFMVHWWHEKTPVWVWAPVCRQIAKLPPLVRALQLATYPVLYAFPPCEAPV
jgi:hypothetical protein